VFQRALLDDQVLWVPRVTQDRQPLCGRAPSVAPAAAKVAEPAPARVAKARKVRTDAARSAPQGCADAAPYRAQVPLASGGVAVICLTGAGQLVPESRVLRLEGAVPLMPHQASGAVLVCPRGAGALARLPLADGGETLLCTAGDGSLAGLALPRVQGGPVEAQFVQVASFADPANAERTVSWLTRLGLPVTIGQGKRRGVTFQIVYVGPIADAEQAAAALALVQAAGFRDAFLR
jgi:hypothetical protein